jgi:hypothetical protein
MRLEVLTGVSVRIIDFRHVMLYSLVDRFQKNPLPPYCFFTSSTLMIEAEDFLSNIGTYVPNCTMSHPEDIIL